MKILRVLKDKKGEGFIFTAIFILVFLMIFCLITEFIRLFIIAQGVRDAVQSAVISTVNDNYDDVYHSVRESYSAGYKPTESGFAESLDFGDVYGYLDELLGTVESDGKHVKYFDSGGIEFYISNLQINIKNLPLQSGNSENFEAEVSLLLEVPVKFGSEVFPNMKINLKLKAKYIPKF